MPSIQCQECGKELLPQKRDNSSDYCICPDCGREVFIRSKKGLEVKCPTCDKKNKTSVAL